MTLAVNAESICDAGRYLTCVVKPMHVVQYRHQNLRCLASHTRDRLHSLDALVFFGDRLQTSFDFHLLFAECIELS